MPDAGRQMPDCSMEDTVGIGGPQRELPSPCSQFPGSGIRHPVSVTEDAVWDALARALAGEYEIVARLGLGSGGAPAYLARELLTDNLVALRLPPLVSGNEAQEYGLEVVRQIDSTLPDIETRCSHCGTTLRQWSRFCSRCGRDISGISPATSGQTREQLRQVAQEAATGKFEILGEMTRVEGGGLVYFGREVASGRVVGLQIEPGPEATVMMTATEFAAPDPSFELAEARPGNAGMRRVSVPKERMSTPAFGVGSPQKETAAKGSKVLPVAAVILLLVIAAFATCRVS
jgi:hypothetical protein